jgi:hypothetical protein
VFVYQVLFWLGTVGFGAMVAMGFIHGGHGHSDGNGGHGHGHGHLDTGHGQLETGPGHGHSGQHHGSNAGATDTSHGDVGRHGTLTAPARMGGLAKLGRWGKFKSLFAISPIDVFAVSLGAGATGILMRNSVDPALLPYVAALGGAILNYGIIRPMFMFAMKFVGVPSEGLAGAITRTGEAMTKFDSQGRGLIHLVLEGEEKQVLATLDETDRQLGIQVGKGDKLLVLDVDEERNTCRVTRV